MAVTRGRRAAAVCLPAAEGPVRQLRTKFDILPAMAALLVAGGLCRPLPAQNIYKTVDAQGHVVYADRASSKDAPKTSVHFTAADPAEAARLAKEQQQLSTAEMQRAKDEAAAAKSKASSDRSKAQSCDKAKENYYRLKDANRVYQRDADGNRVYLPDNDADTLREQARQAMTAACGG
jgi:Domain of unknown function (DUF4124)